MATTTREGSMNDLSNEITLLNGDIDNAWMNARNSGGKASLEWNRMEEIAFMELKRDSTSIILALLNGDKTVSEILEVFEYQVERYIDDLVGMGGFDDHKGPWICNSTSIGSRQLALVECNTKRWEIKKLKKLIKKLS